MLLGLYSVIPRPGWFGPAARDGRDPASSTDSAPPAAASFHIPSLDGIRAVAFLLVFFNHVGWTRFPAALGVTIFFFLSGYLITTLLRREFDRTGGVALGAFYLRRVYRILPPLYVVLLAALVVKAVVDPAGLRWAALIAQVCQFSNYYVIYWKDEGLSLGMIVTWSLAVEEHFYLLFPLVYLLLRRRLTAGGQAIALLALCGLVLAWRCVLVYGADVPWIRIYSASDTRADALLFGCILAVVGNPALDVAGPARRRWDLALVPVALLVIAACWVIPGHRFHHTFRYTLQSLAMMPLFTAAVRYPDWLPFRPLQWRVTRWVGVLSYSLYLIHLNVIEWLLPLGLSRAPLAIVSLAISLGLACAMDRWVERPCARLRRSIGRAPRATAGLQPALALQ